MKPIAVIILNWNGADLLDRYLPSVVDHTPDAIADVIVADNGSEDSSIDLLRSRFPSVRILPLGKNYGFAEGYNRAVDATGYRYTVLLNSDVRVADDWLTPLYDFMRGHPEVGACQPKILSARDESMFEYAGACGGFLDRHGYPYCRGRIFDTVERDNGQYDDARYIFWASGAALMVDTTLYKEAGGLDPSFFAHMEEIDLCWRMQLLGRKIAVVPASRVYHLGGASLDASNPRKTYLNFRNNLLMLHKNLPPGGARRRLLLVRRLLDTAAWAKFVVTLKWGHAAAIFRAHTDYRRMKKATDVTPCPVHRNLLRDTLEGRADIIIDYYLRGRRLFGCRSAK